VALVAFVLVTLAVGFVAGQVTVPNIPGWYEHLAKPAFNPPNWVFAPVWTVLYLAMAVAAWRIWRKQGLRNTALALWALQLALNFCWSILFFGAHAILLALVDLCLLWLMILATLIVFWRTDRLAGLLLVPYLGWVSFAGLLNAAILTLNG
jgi:tryptophan-rich sensory protein